MLGVCISFSADTRVVSEIVISIGIDNPAVEAVVGEEDGGEEEETVMGVVGSSVPGLRRTAVEVEMVEGLFRKMVYTITVAVVTASTTNADGDGFVEEVYFIVVCIVGSAYMPSFLDGFSTADLFAALLLH